MLLALQVDRMCACPISQWVLSSVWVGRGGGVLVHIVLSRMGKWVAWWVCGLRWAWGKLVATGDIISRKNKKIETQPSHPARCPLTLHHPAVHELMSIFCAFFLCSSSYTDSPPFCVIDQFSNCLFTQTLIQLTYMHSVAFIRPFLKQIVYWLYNINPRKHEHNVFQLFWSFKFFLTACKCTPNTNNNISAQTTLHLFQKALIFVTVCDWHRPCAWIAYRKTFHLFWLTLVFRKNVRCSFCSSCGAFGGIWLCAFNQTQKRNL